MPTAAGAVVPNLHRVGTNGLGRGRRGLRAVLSCACAIAAIGAAPAAADEVGDFQGTWVDRALDIQYELGFDVPLRNAPYVGTHNSFNSVAEMGPTLSTMDSNQQLGLVDQLDVDVRSIELDLHRFPSAQGAGYRPVVCHALGGGVGCTVEKELDPILAEISGWLRDPENSEQVLLLYLEDDLDTEGTHDDAAEIIETELGDLVYRPEGGRGCEEVSTELTRKEIRDSGKQVLIVSGCGKGDAWQSLAFSWADHRESRPFDFADFPDCGPDYTIADSRKHLIRYFEDSTKVTRGTGDARRWADPGDRRRDGPLRRRPRRPRPARAVRRPPRGAGLELGARAAEHRPLRDQQGRRQVPVRSLVLQAVRLAARAGPPAARATAGSFRAVAPTSRRGSPSASDRGARLAVPRSGYENQLLRLAMAKRGARSAMLGLRLKRDTWTAARPARRAEEEKDVSLRLRQPSRGGRGGRAPGATRSAARVRRPGGSPTTRPCPRRRR